MEINEITVISGKGGTGKTTFTASLIPYFDNLVIADCDVDAPDLDILFDKKIIEEKEFIGLHKAFVDADKCIKCGLCYEKCKFDAIDKEINIKTVKCEGCGLCEFVCPVKAIEMKDAVVGKLYVSDTKYGKMIHAKLIPGEETSGKLVTAVRKKAKQTAAEEGRDTIITDGSPGIGCNVISSITGVKKAVIVTEPTQSGLHDLIRVYELTKKFRLKVFVVINKYDLSISKTEEIENYCKEKGIENILRIPFNKKIVEAVVRKEIPSLYDQEFYKNIGFEKFIDKLKK